VRRFWRWLKGLPRGKDPPETEWISIGKAQNRTILPQGLLTKEETQKLIEAAEHPRDKAYVAVAGESRGRRGEVSTMKVRSVTCDEYGAVIVVRGKRDERRTRLVASAPHLADSPNASYRIPLNGTVCFLRFPFTSCTCRGDSSSLLAYTKA
jgi:integrase